MRMMHRFFHPFILPGLLTFPLLVEDANELSTKATDPTASLMALNLQCNWKDSHGIAPSGESDERTTLFPSF